MVPLDGLVHSAGGFDGCSVLVWYDDFLASFRAANEVSTSICLQNVSPENWRTSCEETFKINTDVAIDVNRQLVGVGLVVCNHLWRVIACSAQQIHASYSPFIVEEVAVWHGIILMVEAGLYPFVIETDALSVV